MQVQRAAHRISGLFRSNVDVANKAAAITVKKVATAASGGSVESCAALHSVSVNPVHDLMYQPGLIASATSLPMPTYSFGDGDLR
ncbi:MAG TPA: hypothetical protein VHS58_17445 [Acetobacteraceae bacterium]|nr:hypothetical protein [Acetobacteraceae bacterium]